MRRIVIVLIFLLCGLFCVPAQGQETGDSRSLQLIELEGDNGRVLLFPELFPGPDGPIIKFVMFGIAETPEVDVRTAKGFATPKITPVLFEKGRYFSGWFDAPEEEIISIWINGWFISWDDR